MSRRRALTIVLALAVIAVTVVGALRVFADSGGKRITAYFDHAVGVYPGSDLRILGVKVGEVDSVTPEGRQVKVVVTVDRGVRVPKDVRAAVVSPSVVADRYVQLAPAYTGGPEVADRAVLPAARNATPVEVDQLYASITELSKSLGPDGANSSGALSGLLDAGAKNLNGNGAAIGDSIEQFGKAAKTLDGSSEHLFATLSYLQTFTTMLKNKDGAVRDAQNQLADVTSFFADNKDNLAGALKELGTALGNVKTFIQDNRGSLKAEVDKLAPLTQILVEQRASLAEALDTAPLAAGNALNAYDPVHRTLDGRGNINEVSMGGDIVFPGNPSVAGSAGLVPVPESRLKALPALPLPAVGTVYGTSDAPAKGSAGGSASGSTGQNSTGKNSTGGKGSR
ncbi:MCE family protein [Streptomyces xanthochromogenes]|uniref:ABC transporter substrate-binding protein n=1 Tax=Streptomyces xanthochromogenes TaxID=67384 RepID=A0ABQ3A8F8_9ACTN|nr:MCE family protein [Streptomyces xanthochromogenes]GGY36645.1 ABC transporter substrate-binding protein [Streptomyces xanthochromogenes]